MTPSLRAKIFGLNAAKVYGLSAAEVKKYTSRDGIARQRTAYLNNPQPHFRTWGPKTRPRLTPFPGALPAFPEDPTF